MLPIKFVVEINPKVLVLLYFFKNVVFREESMLALLPFLKKIIILVLLVLTCIPIALQKCLRAYKCICNPWADLEINTISSAYKRSFITNSSNRTPSPRCRFSHSSNLSIYRPKRVGDRGKPCLTPPGCG